MNLLLEHMSYDFTYYFTAWSIYKSKNINTELITMKRTKNLPIILVFSYINPSKKEVYVY